MTMIRLIKDEMENKMPDRVVRIPDDDPRKEPLAELRQAGTPVVGASHQISVEEEMAENSLLFESIALKGKCPDCNSHSLKSKRGSILRCFKCKSEFTVTGFTVRRVKS